MQPQPKTTPAKIRILIVDDHIVMRMGLVSAVTAETDMEIVAEAENGREALAAYRLHRPDVVVVDLRMPQLNGFETIESLRKEFGNVHILVFSNYASGEEVSQAFKAGALGFVVKDMPLERLVEAIRRVHQGEPFIPPEISSRMSWRTVSQLTEREVQVLSLVARGLSNKEIGAVLSLVEGTVKVHLTHIIAKLEAADRTHAALIAAKRGIIHLD
jgi:DNA-binding NarL/FixJ family response regulator